MLCSFHDGWVTVAGVVSHVMTWGGWVDDPLPPGDTIILFMCGIPGLTNFYRTFLEELYNRLQIPVWTICIAGNEIPPPDSGLALPDDKSLYNNVKAQINHKAEFVNKYVPRDRKVILIGHSFGGKVVMELLKDDDLLNRIKKCFLLMPTLERFRDAPRAHFWIRLHKTGLMYFFLLFLWLLSFLPLSWHKKVSLWYFQSRYENIDNYCLEAMTDFIGTFSIFNLCRTLAFDELEAIKDLDVDVLTKVSDRTRVFFAPNDYWAPLTHYHSLRIAVPHLQVEMLDSKFQHAFTIDNSYNMADIIASDLKENHEQI